MLSWIFSRLYFFLPVYIANISPPLANRFGLLKFLKKPVDGKKKINNIRILGSHKTWRGVFVEIVNGIIIIYLQRWLYQFSFFEAHSLLNYQRENILLLGFLLSVGAVAGDLMSAFFKRRLKLKPGAKFMPFDQINYIIGAFILLSLFSDINLKIFSWIIILFLTFFLHIVTNLAGYYLGLHTAKW